MWWKMCSKERGEGDKKAQQVIAGLGVMIKSIIAISTLIT
ncbi:hypothetical protein yrohd0001_39240 [Yersinia rohdei ATCC 43380]|nr:hypothetical protein yrohd0001_39240 [Yersinia rohdei ATCC 43380]